MAIDEDAEFGPTARQGWSRDEIYIEELMELYRKFQSNVVDPDDYSYPIAWLMYDLYRSGRRLFVNIRLRNRLYRCTQPLRVFDGRALSISGVNGLSDIYQENQTAFNPVQDFIVPTLSFQGLTTSDVAMIAVRSGINPNIQTDWENGFTANSQLFLNGICIQGPSNFTTTTEAVRGLDIRGKARIRNVVFDRIPHTALQSFASATESSYLSPMFGNANTNTYENIWVRRCGFRGVHIEGGDANACNFSFVDIATWAMNSNFVTGTAAGGDSNCAAVWESSFLGNNFTQVHVGDPLVPHWQIFSTSNSGASTFIDPYIESGQGACAIKIY